MEATRHLKTFEKHFNTKAGSWQHISVQRTRSREAKVSISMPTSCFLQASTKRLRADLF
jgi:hypothetical protein